MFLLLLRIIARRLWTCHHAYLTVSFREVVFVVVVGGGRRNNKQGGEAMHYLLTAGSRRKASPVLRVLQYATAVKKLLFCLMLAAYCDVKVD